VLGTPGLTIGDPRFEEACKRAVPGQADWPAPPFDKLCSDCRYFVDRRCARYAQRMNTTLKRSPKLPLNAIACRLFEERKK
jgi:hypothetical protein